MYRHQSPLARAPLSAQQSAIREAGSRQRKNLPPSRLPRVALETSLHLLGREVWAQAAATSRAFFEVRQ